jgi:3-oxoacyl-[acyl-carrier protein] reductase
VAGTAALFQRALPHMKAQRHGRLIVIAPLAAKRETPGADMDNLVSLGLLGLYKTVSGEVGPWDITANAVLWDDQQAEDDPASLRESIAGTVAYLCSEPAAYITGVAIAVDSGRGPEVF